MEAYSIERLLTEAEGCQEDEGALEAIINELERRVRQEPTPHLKYACAYAWYLHPRRSTVPAIPKRVDDLLKQVLEEVSDDYLSLLYLGHNRYDLGDYADAAQYFSLAKGVATKDYVGLKSHEMEVCSLIMMGELSRALQSFREFVAEAATERYAPEDVWPSELVVALRGSSTLGQLTEGQFSELETLALRIDEVGMLNGWVAAAVRNERRDPMGGGAGS